LTSLKEARRAGNISTFVNEHEADPRGERPPDGRIHRVLPQAQALGSPESPARVRVCRAHSFSASNRPATPPRRRVSSVSAASSATRIASTKAEREAAVG